MRIQLTIILAIGATLASVAVVGGKKLGRLDQMLRETELAAAGQAQEGAALMARELERQREERRALLGEISRLEGQLDDIEGRRHTAHITNQTSDAAVLELAHRQRGAAEDVIRDLKACGYDNWPSECIVNNQTWALLAATAFNLLSRAQRLTLTSRYQRATPKTIRQRLLHIAGRITPAGRRLDLDTTWPWTPTLITGIHKTETLTNRHPA